MEYRVVYKRSGLKQKARRFATRKRAERFMLLFGPEPWKAFHPNANGDDRMCCSGGSSSECGCGGITYREDAENQRATMPPLEYLRLEERAVGEWHKCDECS